MRDSQGGATNAVCLFRDKGNANATYHDDKRRVTHFGMYFFYKYLILLIIFRKERMYIHKETGEKAQVNSPYADKDGKIWIEIKGKTYHVLWSDFVKYYTIERRK